MPVFCRGRRGNSCLSSISRNTFPAERLKLRADAIAAAVIDRRDVPNRETPLHLAVKIGDETAIEMLMLAWRSNLYSR
ncbi:hypothetical protein LIER_17891 [Lithospermum erythrorhizon]|uniref:Uncharacterized protein n=1 Tax=Lithospermum erythrorhizon TaxID=34254 RepID=A0AAV3QF89_LITER